MNQVGPYRITGSYPQGGYRAVDVASGTRVHVEISSADDWRERSIQLLRATSIVGGLDHPGIARLVGRGVLPDRRPWVASELADGVPLCELLARRALSVDETLALIRDLAEVVAHAHARRVVHGAIRPHVIVMCTGDRGFPIQLGGWGDVGSHVRDAGADVQAIGAIAYRALAGRFPPLDATSVPNAPHVVAALITRMLAFGMTALEALAGSVRFLGDRARGAPRLSRPRWTPAPLPDGERVADIRDLAAARDERT